MPSASVKSPATFDISVMVSPSLVTFIMLAPVNLIALPLIRISFSKSPSTEPASPLISEILPCESVMKVTPSLSPLILYLFPRTENSPLSVVKIVTFDKPLPVISAEALTPSILDNFPSTTCTPS